MIRHTSERTPGWSIRLLALVAAVGVVCTLTAQRVLAQSGQIAATPPMGWNSWNHFHGDVSDAIVRAMADAMVSSGMRDAGYRYINIDDTWEGPGRAPDGSIRTNSKFPDMKALCDAPEPIRPDGSPHVVPAQVAHDRIMSLEAEGSAGLRSRFRAHAGALRPAGDRLHGPPGKAVAANRGYANGGHASSGRAACGSSSAALEGSPHWIVLLTTFEGALCVPSLARLTRAKYQVPAARFCTL